MDRNHAVFMHVSTVYGKKPGRGTTLLDNSLCRIYIMPESTRESAALTRRNET